MKRFLLGTTALSACALAAMVGTAHATTSGAAYFVTESQANNAVIGFTHGAAAATFTVPSGTLGFDSRPGNTTAYTLGGFLATGGATILTGTATALGTNLDGANGGLGIANPGGTIIEFTGSVTVTHGEVFTVEHDDGLTLQIGSAVLSDAGPTPPALTNLTYNGPSGTFAFDLVYGECCGAPAVLDVNLPLNVPEPASLAILGSALIGFGAIRRRRKSV